MQFHDKSFPICKCKEVFHILFWCENLFITYTEKRQQWNLLFSISLSRLWGNAVSQEREGTRFSFNLWEGAVESAQSKALPAWVAVLCSLLGRQDPALAWSTAVRGQGCPVHEFAMQEQGQEVKIPGAAWGMTLVLLQGQGFPRTGVGMLGQQFLWIKCQLDIQHNHMEWAQTQILKYRCLTTKFKFPQFSEMFLTAHLKRPNRIIIILYNLAHNYILWWKTIIIGPIWC